MRLAPSEPEARLWQALRANQLGTPFRRQVVVAEVIVDFFVPARRLVVEVDGALHGRRRAADRARDRRLAQLGLRILRLQAQVVLRDSDSALRLIVAALRT